MNYLFLHTTPEWSGAAHAFVDAAIGLARRGHEVTFAADPDSSVEQTVSELGTSVGGGRPAVRVEPIAVGRSTFAAAQTLRGVARRTRAAVVIVHTAREHLIAALAHRLGSRARVVRRVPAGGRLDASFRTRFASFLSRTTYLFASENDRRTASLPRGAVAVVAPLGVDIDATPPAPEPDAPIEVVCVHDATARSRAATAIRTVAMLAPRHPRLVLRIVGDSTYDDDLRMQAAALDALPLVSFLGERADEIEIMRRARLGWVAADDDAGAYGVLGFMALGVPVIAAQGSVAEQYMLNEITGRLLPPDDAFLIAAAAAELLTNESRREMMGSAARSRVQREFPLSAMIDGFEHAAAAALAPRRR